MQRWLGIFMAASASVDGARFCDLLGSRFLSRWGRPVGSLHTELPGVLGVQPLPAFELHGRGPGDASNGLAGEKPIQHIEADVPARGAHGDVAVTDVGPQGQARAASDGFELPSHIEVTPGVLEQVGSVGSLYGGFRDAGRPHGAEFYRASSNSQAPIGVKGSPLAQMRRVSQRLPDFFRRVAQLSDQNERPLLSIFLYPRSHGRTGYVLLAIGHLSAPPAYQLFSCVI